MLRILLIAVLFYLIIWIGRGLVSGRGTGGAAPEDTELVEDALTGVYFPKGEAVTVNRGGRIYYFLSRDNRDAWLAKGGGQP
ncbi:MAG: hypothetical protein LBO05_13175 [Deltaproteobacteria bacterium]|jgi:hypothetical protein|nr:hypothetical protein [Deltaproteobacteria bacterium]